MKKFGTKQLVPILTAIMGIVFAYVGFFELGFWDTTQGEGPMPGFFPSIIAVVMVITSIMAFFQSLKDTEAAVYHKDEIKVILCGCAIFAGTFLIGLLPMCYLMVIAWLRFFEKESWKNTIKVTVVIAVITLGVFYFWLGVQFTMGLFEYIL